MLFLQNFIPKTMSAIGSVSATAKKIVSNMITVNLSGKNADYKSMSWLNPDRSNVPDVIWRGT
jgi:hypothetical protein